MADGEGRVQGIDAETEATPEYFAFVEKFRPKRTTDDCETPGNVYEAVADWVAKRYGVDRSAFVRPFWPGCDYQAADYPGGCVVVDNPPFSIVTRIARWYGARGIRYFLFCPYLTSLQVGKGELCCHVFAPANITYCNGAVVRTSFLTNLDTRYVAESAPDLLEALDACEKANSAKKALPKYAYPADIATANAIGRLAEQGIAVRIPMGEAVAVSRLDAQRSAGKTIFGGGLLLSRRAAAMMEEAKAEAGRRIRERARRAVESMGAETDHDGRIVWTLSAREKALQGMIGAKE